MIDYDVIIIGSGPAGMNACLYATRANLKTLVIERNCPGGKVIKANKIENWIGTQNITGSDLALNMFKHAFSNGGVYEQNNVLDIVDCGKYKEVVLKKNVGRREFCDSPRLSVFMSTLQFLKHPRKSQISYTKFDNPQYRFPASRIQIGILLQRLRLQGRKHHLR